MSFQVEEDKPIYESLTGVLVDVSGSMREAFSLDRTVSGSVERTHAIITTLNGMVKKETAARDHRKDGIFVSAFGLRDVYTCDLVQLLDYYETTSHAAETTSETTQQNSEGGANLSARDLELVRKDKAVPEHYSMDGYDVLVKFANEKNAAHAERWIRRKCLTEPEAGVLYTILSRDENLTKEFIEKLPGRWKSHSLDWTSFFSFGYVDASDSQVKNSEAYKLAKKVIHHFADITIFLQKPGAQIPKIQPVKEVSDLLDKILKKNRTLSQPTLSESNPCDDRPNHSDASGIAGPPPKKQALSSNQSSGKVKDLFDYLTPFIFGCTPMVKSLNHAKSIFDQNKANEKILFILSDGLPSFGDPLPVAREIRTSNVTVVTCFLTEKEIRTPKRLMDNSNFNFAANEGATRLFKMSSSMHNTKPPVSYFVDAGWELPTSGESKLFLQANSLDLVDEFCKIIFSHMENNTCVDALIDILASVSVADYINVKNSEFEPRDQSGKTCYANAIAVVYHLAMCQIVDREGGVPKFEQILQDVTIFDENVGGNTRFVLERTCSKYGLKFTEVDEKDARIALNERRPVIARFTFNHRQKRKFGEFFMNNGSGILKSENLSGLSGSSHVMGHAVVLVRCEPSCLKFMNSWGQDWGDGGFFRIENSKVLPDMKFYDVDVLTPSRKDALTRKGTDEAKKISQTFSSINELDYECPECQQVSKVGDYAGNLLAAQCPKCQKVFKPSHEGVMQSLYISSRNFI